jgi:hypothetical protein
MSVLRRSVATAMVALAIAGADASAQTVAHPKDFQWTVGGQGGLLLVETPDGETAELPMAGIQTVIRARRTALLLSVQQAFGDEEIGGGYTVTTFDENGAPTGSSTTPVTWDWARKYSAALVVFPIRGHIDPYLGVGAGILQVGGFGDDGFADELSSMGYGTLIGGLELSAGRFMVFGEYQLTTAPRVQSFEQRDDDGNPIFVAAGRFTQGPTHSLSAGLRVSLGSAREQVGGGDGI